MIGNMRIVHFIIEYLSQALSLPVLYYIGFGLCLTRSSRCLFPCLHEMMDVPPCQWGPSWDQTRLLPDQPSLELPTLDCWERLGSPQWGGQGDISLHWSYPHWTAGRGWGPLSGVGRVTSAFTGATHTGLLLSVGRAGWHQPSLELPTLDCWERLGSSQWGGQGDISLHWSYPHWTAPLSGAGRVTSAFTGATHTGLLG